MVVCSRSTQPIDVRLIVIIESSLITVYALQEPGACHILTVDRLTGLSAESPITVQSPAFHIRQFCRTCQPIIVPGRSGLYKPYSGPCAIFGVTIMVLEVPSSLLSAILVSDMVIFSRRALQLETHIKVP